MAGVGVPFAATGERAELDVRAHVAHDSSDAVAGAVVHGLAEGGDPVGVPGKELEQQVEARMGRRELLEGEDAPPFRTILSEAVLRTPLRDVGEWRGQLECLRAAAERANVTVHVLLQGAGPHGLMSADMWYLLLPEGRTVAYTENGYQGELIEESSSVVRLQNTYDAVRDLALTPAESRKFILRMLEEAPCDPST